MLKKIFLSLMVLMFSIIPLSAKKVALVVGVPSLFNEQVADGIRIDVRNMEDLLKGYGFEVIKLVDNEETTLRNLRNVFKKQQSLNSNDIFVFYFSGHGAQIVDDNGDEKDGKDEVILLSDYQQRDKSLKGILVDDEMYNLLSKIKAKKIIFFDSCHSGTAFKSKKSNKFQIKSYGFIPGIKGVGISPRAEKSQSSILFFGAAKDSEESIATVSGSMFTLALIDGLKREKADLNNDKKITPRELNNFCITDIKEQLQRNGYGHTFTPQLNGDNEYFNIDLLSEIKGYSSFELEMDKIIHDGIAEKMDVSMNKNSFSLGERINFSFDSGGFKGYLYVLYVDKDNITVLYPNKFDPNAREISGYVKFPTDISNRFDLEAQKPFGRTVIYVLLSKKILDLYGQGKGRELFRTLPVNSGRAKSIPKGLRGIGVVSKNTLLKIGKVEFTVEK